MKPYLLHPAAVHFPLALLITGLGLCAVDARSKRPPWTADAASWLLWLGTASAWAAAGLGLLAARTAPHAPPAWETLADHRTLGLWTAAMFTLLSAWRFFRPSWAPRLFLTAWIAASAVLVSAARLGGELVFAYNMATAANEP